MASSGGMWHNAKSGSRTFAQKGESRAKASARGDASLKKAFMSSAKKIKPRGRF
jgi:hypothetical protein